MDPTDIGLFHIVERRLGWVDKRQQLLAQNVANANTPGYQPRDLESFGAVLHLAGLAQTSPMHFGAAGMTAEAALGRGSGRAPGGNSVSIEDELGKVADTANIQQLTVNLDRSYVGMFRTALGRAG